jgi:phosphatidylglycerol:prolipoprotein diacylglycerol transferase
MSDGFSIPSIILKVLVIAFAIFGGVMSVRDAIQNRKRVDLLNDLYPWVGVLLIGIVAWIWITEPTIYIRYYGIILMSGAVAGGILASYEVKRRGYDPEIVWDLLVYLIVGGVIGARLWHVFTPPPSSIALGITTEYYLRHPIDILEIWKGGLGIPGTIIGGLIALYVYVRNNKAISFAEWVDIAAPSLALGQAIGRWGNFFNQELYGAPTNLPWKIYIDPAHRLGGFESDSYYHPLFAYESVWNLLNMLFLMWITRQYSGRLKKGDVFLVYLIIYPMGRFFLDFLRLDASKVFSININQTVMAVVAICAALAFYWRHRAGAGDEQGAIRTAEGTYPMSTAMALEPKAAAPRPLKKSVAQKKAGASDKKPMARKKTTKRPASKKTGR